VALDSTSVRRVVVIGAGITGLAAAHHLCELAASREMPLEVTIIERGDRAGGPLKTVRRDGFIMEAGTDSMLVEKPWAADLARRIGLGEELIPTRAEFRRTLVVHAGRMVEIPDGFSLLAPARLGPVLRSPLFSPLGKLRMMLEPFIPARRDAGDESLASFVKRRLGREVLDRVAQPLAGGIYTADPERLSIQATMPRFVEMERKYGSLVRGLRAAAKTRAAQSGETSGARWNLFVTLRSGIGTLADALAARLARSLRYGAEAAALTRAGETWNVALGDGTALEADAIICAAPAPAAARLVAPHDQQLAERLRAISYASAAVVNLTYRESDFPSPPRTFGFVVPIAERRKIIAGSFSSLKYEGRAPAGWIIARTFMGGVLQSAMIGLGDDEMIAAAREEMRLLLGVSAAPSIAEVQRWPDAMPQYEVGHLDRVSEIERAAAKIPALVLACAAYRGVGIPDCIRGGEEAARATIERFTANP
jgi:protoporphyrinogen/coproporphyrinogen III oxidase